MSLSNHVLMCYLSIILLTDVLILGVGAYEGTSRQVRCPRGGDLLVLKHQEIENKEQDQYKEAFCTLNEELTSVNAKLKEKSRLLEEAENVRATLATELSTFHEQMDKAKADVVTEFRAS